MKLRLIAILALLVLGATVALAQGTAINSTGVPFVFNNAPNVVRFSFPTGPASNIVMIEFGCSDSPIHEIFIYERQPNGYITTYPFTAPPGLDCNELFSPDNDADDATFIGSLKGDTTFTTADHAVTIKASTAWTAAKGSRAAWYGTSGSSQITVQ